MREIWKMALVENDWNHETKSYDLNHSEVVNSVSNRPGNFLAYYPVSIGLTQKKRGTSEEEVIAGP